MKRARHPVAEPRCTECWLLAPRHAHYCSKGRVADDPLARMSDPQWQELNELHRQVCAAFAPALAEWTTRQPPAVARRKLRALLRVLKGKK